ncbi:MAG: class I SAM-dependent methyltransferase [Armatimonadota bacterium]
MPRCRLCGSSNTELLHQGGARSHHRDFYHCPPAQAGCDLVFVPDRFLLNPAQERERYLLHENDPNDEGYRAFLARLLDEVAPRVEPGAEGLDYGCGEPPVLVMMLRERGLRAEGWDLFFAPDAALLERTYDFVTCSETAEHFKRPLIEFERFDRLLRPGGLLGVMTQMLEDWCDFESWHYRCDETHISYFSPTTMRWIADRFGWTVSFPRETVTIFRKPEEEPS